MGIKGLLLRWISGFLSDRIQMVKVGSAVSKPVDVLSGVPQGSVLGPILFLLYINDVTKLNVNCVLKLFADDLKLYKALCDDYSVDAVQSCLDKISSWSALWQLKLAPSKCMVISFGSKVTEYNYFINNCEINRAHSVKDLGVYFNSSLCFNDHINQICATANQRAALILKSFVSRSPVLLFKAFSTFVRPLVEYASCVWNPSGVTLINKLESVQRRFTKKLQGYKDLAYSDRLLLLQADTLELRRLYCDLLMYFKILNNKLDINPSDHFKFSHNSRTRGNSLKLIKPSHFTCLSVGQFNTRAIDAWNDLPNEIVTCVSAPCFKAMLRFVDFSHYCKATLV